MQLTETQQYEDKDAQGNWHPRTFQPSKVSTKYAPAWCLEDAIGSRLTVEGADKARGWPFCDEGSLEPSS